MDLTLICQTKKNVEVLAEWLGAHRYQTMYRPVPIDEHLVYESAIYAASSTGSMLKAATQSKLGPIQTQGPSNPVRLIQPSLHKELQDPVLNAVVSLANETVRSGYGVLVFCSSRLGCETDARVISRVVPGAEELDAISAEKRADLLGELRSLPSGLDSVLAETVPFGVAFHRKPGATARECDR